MLSIIILTYKDDYKYLEQCIDSIKKSVHCSYEIIIIYNGKEKYKGVISTGENLGCIEGRRIGFNHSKGDYIWFVDADDTVKGDITESLFESKSDIVQCYYEIMKDDNCVVKMSKFNPNIFSIPNGLWCRFFSRQLLEESYKELPYSPYVFKDEDKILLDICKKKFKKIVYFDKIIYSYRFYRGLSYKNSRR